MPARPQCRRGSAADRPARPARIARRRWRPAAVGGLTRARTPWPTPSRGRAWIPRPPRGFSPQGNSKRHPRRIEGISARDRVVIVEASSPPVAPPAKRSMRCSREAAPSLGVLAVVDREHGGGRPSRSRTSGCCTNYYQRTTSDRGITEPGSRPSRRGGDRLILPRTAP